MTGGTVVVLGNTGRNFGAGMSGGIAYVYDIDGEFSKKCNHEMVRLESVLDASTQEATVDRSIWHSEQRGGIKEADEVLLKRLIETHAEQTNSDIAKSLLNSWSDSISRFVKVFPAEYKRALTDMATMNVDKNDQKVA